MIFVYPAISGVDDYSYYAECVKVELMSIVTRILSCFTGNHLTAVILASGSGTRMGGDVPKQFIEINNKSVLQRSVEAFENAELVDSIIIVTKQEYKSKVEEQFLTTGHPKIIKVVTGGETRFLSAFAGMEACPEKTTHIAIHDAARCLVTPEMIDKVAASAFKTSSSFASCRSGDTVKLVDKNGLTLTGDRQLIRSSLVCAQTPQIFKFTLYCAAAYTAKKDGFSATDDCSLLEHIGFTCHPVDCGCENIKITSGQDIFTAEGILKARGEK